MPVHFKGSSEYKKHYLPFQSYKSASFEPMAEQAANAAGKDTAVLGVPMEPPLQRKKRCVGPSVTLSTNFYDMDSPSPVPEEYALLGVNDKFVTNVKYRAKQRGVSPPKQQKLSKTVGSKVNNSKENPKPASKPAPAPVVNTEQFSKQASATPKITTPLAPRKQKDKSASVIQEAKTETTTAKKALPQELCLPLKSKDPTQKKHKGVDVDVNKKESLTKLPLKDKNFNNMNEFVQTNMEKGVADSAPEAPASYALKYKAGIAPPRPRRKVSEYQKSFDWKSGGKASPLLAAEQVVYNSNPQVAPFRKDVVPKKSEYSTQFKEWKYSVPSAEEEVSVTKGSKTKKRPKVQRSKSLEAIANLPAAGSSAVVTSDNKRLTKETQEEERRAAPPVGHGKLKRHRSEYAMNFKAPSQFQYVQGAWRGANPPHLQSTENLAECPDDAPALSNWFAEVIELRRKAQEYRKRAQGTHFSREHLVQLMARQTQAWEAPSTVRSNHSTLSALSLETGSARMDNKKDSARATIASDEQVDEADVETQAREEQCQEDINSICTPSVEDEEEDGGRIPTPQWKEVKKRRSHRHHLDLTTPSVGGAILSSPPQVSKSRPQRKQNQKVCKSTPLLKLQDVDDSDDETVEEVPVHQPIAGQGEFSVSKGFITPTPTYGMPSRDTHFLRDEEESQDAPLQTSFVHSPLKNQGKKKSSPKGFKLQGTIKEGYGQTYNVPGFIKKTQDDDAVSIASSCSLASETLERAKKRTEEFWGKNGIATR